MNSSSDFKVSKDLHGFLQNEAAFIITFDCKILYASDKALGIHGWERDEVLDHNFLTLCEKSGLSFPLESYIEQARTGKWEETEKEISVVQERFTTNFYYQFGPYYYDGELEAITVLVHSLRKSIDLKRQADVLARHLKEELEKTRSQARMGRAGGVALKTRSKRRINVPEERPARKDEGSMSSLFAVLEETYSIGGFSELTLLLDALYNAPASFYVKDSQGRHLYCNGLALKALGVDSFSEIQNKTTEECLQGKGLSREAIEAVLKNDNAVLEGQSEFCEVEKASMDGLSVYFISNKTCIKHEESDEPILVGVSTYTTNPSTLIGAFV